MSHYKKGYNECKKEVFKILKEISSNMQTSMIFSNYLDNIIKILKERLK